MTIRNNLTPEEISEVEKNFPFDFSADDEQRMNDKFEPRLIIGRSTSGKRRYVRCTACGKDEVWMDDRPSPKHNAEAMCPFCRANVRVIHAGRYSRPSSLNEEYHAAWMRPAPDGGLLIEAGFVSRRWSMDWVCQGEIPGEDVDEAKYLTYEGFFKPHRRYYLAPGKAWMQDYDTVREPFAANMMGSGNYDGSYVLFGIHALEETSMRYCQLIDWYFNQTGNDLEEDDIEVKAVIKYLAHYTQYPTMELAVKIGFDREVYSLLTGLKNFGYLDWSKTTPAGFLRLSKQDAKAFLQNNLTFPDLVAIHDLRLSVIQYASLCRRVGSKERLESISRCAKRAGVTLQRAVNYVVKNTPQCSRAGVSMGDVIQYWSDYLAFAATLDYDLAREDVALPRNLKERHDAAAALVKYKQNEAAWAKYEKRYKKLCKRYEFRYGGMMIVVPTSADEIVTEGRVLKHCVGGYAKRHIDGKLDILFLRHERKPGVPFLTIEMREATGVKKRVFLQQIHGYRNEGYLKPGVQREAARPEHKYAWFLDAWQTWLDAGSPRDKSGKPIIKEVQTA